MTDEPADSGDEPRLGTDEVIEPAAEEVDGELVDRVRQAASRPEVRALFTEMRAHRGPLPAPDDLRTYDEILPGSAERLLSIVEREQAHRHGIEDALAESDIRDTLRGMWMAFTVTLAFLVAGVAAILTGHSIEGLGTILVGLTPVVGAFILRRWSHRPSE